MSNVHVCEHCGAAAWESDGTIFQRTVEGETPGGMIVSKEMELCNSCHVDYMGGDAR